MKSVLLILSVFLFSATQAQPKNKGTDLTVGGGKMVTAGTAAYDSISLKRISVKDTVNANIIVYDSEGYLQRKSGKVIRKIWVYENRSIQPEVYEAKYFDDKWAAIKNENVYEAKTKQ